jgi:SHS2 domain-containing protein
MNVKQVDYFDHDADIGIIGRGATLEDAFVAAALAVFNLMTDPSLVIPRYNIKIYFEETDNELALVIWLNRLLAKSHELNLIFSKFDLQRQAGVWTGHAYGDHWQVSSPRGTEVKGATLTMLKVNQNDHWEARCVVDV